MRLLLGQSVALAQLLEVCQHQRPRQSCALAADSNANKFYGLENMSSLQGERWHMKEN